MIAEHLERHALLGHRHDRLLVHVRVVNSHPAEDRERLHKVFVIFGKDLRKDHVDRWTCGSTEAHTHQTVKLVDQLYHADDLPERVLDRHAEDRFVPEALAVVDARVEAIVLVRVADIYSLQKGGRDQRSYLEPTTLS